MSSNQASHHPSLSCSAIKSLIMALVIIPADLFKILFSKLEMRQ
jgi:hypothetical protein